MTFARPAKFWSHYTWQKCQIFLAKVATNLANIKDQKSKSEVNKPKAMFLACWVSAPVAEGEITRSRFFKCEWNEFLKNLRNIVLDDYHNYVRFTKAFHFDKS